MKKKVKAACPVAITQKNPKKPLVKMDSDEILEIYANRFATGEKREAKKQPKMKVSGKSVFKLKDIITKKPA